MSKWKCPFCNTRHTTQEVPTYSVGTTPAGRNVILSLLPNGKILAWVQGYKKTVSLLPEQRITQAEILVLVDTFIDQNKEE